MPTPATSAEVRTFAARFPADAAQTILEKTRRWSELRVYASGPWVYCLYYDRDGALRDYLLLHE